MSLLTGRAYVSFAVAVCFPMLMIWFNKPHDLNTFTPAWAFLVSATPLFTNDLFYKFGYRFFLW